MKKEVIVLASLIVFALLVIPTAPPYASVTEDHELKSYVTNDTNVDEQYPDSPQGASASIIVSTVGSSPDKRKRIFLRFGLEDIPSGHEVSSVILYLYCKVHYEGEWTEVWSVENDTWDQAGENGTTWNDPPEIVTFLDDSFVDDAEKWFGWDVTDFAVSQIDNDDMVSLCVKYSNAVEAETDYLEEIFQSQEFTVLYKPYILITWVNNLPLAPHAWTNLGMNLTDHTPTVTWTKGTDADGETVTTYVYVGTTQTPTQVETSTTGETADLGNTVTLSDGVTYYYRFRSWDGYDYSQYTNADTFRMNSKPANPTSWTNLGMNLTDHTPTVTWSGQSDSESDTITVYAYVGSTTTPTDAEGYSTTGTLDLGSTIPLSDGLTYYYRLRAHDGYEWNDSYTSADTLRMNTPPTTPTDPTDLSLNETDHTPNVSWTDSTDAESDSITYHVETSANGTDFYLDWSGSDNYCTLDYYTFDDGEDYWWRVSAHDGHEYSGWAPSSAGDEFQFNQIPTVSPAVTPADPISTDNLICAPNGNDPDGDDMTYTYQWYENDALMSGYTENVLDNAQTVMNNVYLCEVIPYDSHEYGNAENSNEVMVGNATPTKPTNWTNLGMNLVDHTPTITWTKGTDDDADPVTTYVYVGTTSTPTAVETTTEGETVNLGTTTTLTDGTTYYYRLRSWDGKVFSGYTTADEFRMNTPPNVPMDANDLGMNLIDHTPNKTFIKGTDAEGDTVYTIAYLGTSPGPTEEDVRGIGTSLTLGENAAHSCYPLVDGQTYYVQLQSWDEYEWSAGYSPWQYRIPITLNIGASVPPKNYQYTIVLDKVDDLDNDCLDNFQDIRFLEDMGSGELSFWIKEYTSGDDATFVFKRVENSLSDNQIYVYFGNDSAASVDNAYTTFIQYHDATDAAFHDDNVVSTPFIYEARVRQTSGGNALWGLSENGSIEVAPGDAIGVLSTTSGNRKYFKSWDDGVQSYVYEAPAFTDDIWYDLQIVVTAGEANAYSNTNEISTGITTNIPDEAMGLSMEIPSGTGEQEYSLAREYVANVPTETLGSIELFLPDDDEFRMNSLPTIPTNFTDLEDNLYNHFPIVNWTKGTDAEGDIVQTYVYVGTTSTPTAVEESTTGATASLGTVITLDDNAAYYYRLRSWDGYEWSAYTTADGFSMAPKIVSPATIILGLVVCMTFAFAYLYFKVARVHDLISGGEAIRGVFIFVMAIIIMWAIAYGLITNI